MTFRNDAGLAFLIDDETGRVYQHQYILALEELLDLLVALTAVSLSALAMPELDIDLTTILGIIITIDVKVRLLQAEELLLEQILVPAARFVRWIKLRSYCTFVHS